MGVFGVDDFKYDIGFDIIKMADTKWRKNCINFEFFQTKSRTQGFSRSLMMNLIFFYGKTKWMIQNVEEIPKIFILLKKKIDYLGICRVLNYESNISFSEHKIADSKWLTVFGKNSKTTAVATRVSPLQFGDFST